MAGKDDVCMLATHDETSNRQNTPIRPVRTPPPYDSTPASNEVDFHELVKRIQSGDTSGMEDLYRIFSRGVRFYLCRQLGPQELEDKVHDTFLIVVQALRRGDLRDPDRLMGFVRTVVRRQVAAHIDNAVQSRRECLDVEAGASFASTSTGPEENAILRQNADLMEKVLDGMSHRDREILTRFYLDEQPQDQICREMRLTETQFRLLKSRAKTRFGELGKKKLIRKPIRTVFMRNSMTA
jgi:RNA polymerase sigma factor (sigma-70 family)